jgi:glycerol-3-phosphate dehydrogenase (NAD(P)+)
MKVAILGSGAWGRALATLVAEAGHRPHIGYRGRPPGGFPGSPNLAGLVRDADLVLIAVPAGAVREVIQNARPGPRDQVVIASRGLELETGGWLSDTVTTESACLQVGVLAGPAIAAEVMQRQPSAQVVASRYDAVCQRTQTALHSASCRVYTSSDLLGVELAGACTATYAVVLGLAAALGQGVSVRGVIVTRGLAEANRLGRALGADDATFVGLAGVGDLVAAGAHPAHPGYAAGRLLGEGKTPPASLPLEVNALLSLAHRHGVELPMLQALAAVIAGKLRPRLALDMLMRREAKQSER